MKRFFALAGLALTTLPLAQPASAQLVEEARIGVMQHNICVTDCKNANKEDGPTVEGELVFASPDFLNLLLGPRPYALASVNTAGDTSYGALGLMWNWDFAQGWSLEPSLGYAIHDGAKSSPYPQGSPESAAFAENNLLLGSKDLFRTGLAINRDIGENWGLQVQYEHLSHGQILGNGRNQGVDSIGMRAYWRFGR
ncbi:acyloxyacyl hydrolase [Henriciella aquimarina]|uniref:acyloxyacyl hydrolase n=1 Tax=Henriciella aquimarina TaxID=545261 RepID=UPI000A06D36C|nr:acyloxyacyl hydrolase [Henriciella aquimarina]